MSWFSKYIRKYTIDKKQKTRTWTSINLQSFAIFEFVCASFVHRLWTKYIENKHLLWGWKRGSHREWEVPEDTWSGVSCPRVCWSWLICCYHGRGCICFCNTPHRNCNQKWSIWGKISAGKLSKSLLVWLWHCRVW